jgi:hypothetical protein
MPQEKGSERQVEPRLSPQLAELREKLRCETYSGEPFEVTATNRELEEAIAWYVDRRPRIPFRNPQVSIDDEGVEARGEAHLGKYKLRVSGRASVFVQDGLPIVTVEQLQLGKVGLPRLVLTQVEAELDKQLNVRKEDLPAIIEGIELEEGRVTVWGKIR